MESFTAPSRSVKNVQFGLFSPEEIRSMSVTSEGIQFPMTMASGCQVNGGLMDPRQGPLDRHSRCRTCAGDMTDCPGHFGHIELVKPVFHAGFLPKVVKVLRCICFYCSKLLIAKNDPRLQSLTRASSMQFTVRFAHVFNVCKNIQVCEVDLDGDSGCGRYQPSIKREGLEVIAIWKHEKVQGNRQTFTAERIREILSNVSDEDCELMGFNLQFGRPDWMILTVLPVPPPCVRPAVMSGAKKSHDDLTYKLADILKANINLRGYIRRGANDQLIQENIKLLQFHVASYMDDNLPKGIPLSIHLSGKPLKSISSRIRGKDGRIRGNLMGKRVDFCARTVITADPNLGIDQVGVPLSIARNLTYPELVTPFNIDQMQRLVARGHSQYPGANYIIRSNGDRIDLRFCPKPSDLHLEYGYKVERHLRDGDLVVFNRQPSLHKMSMMGHRVKVLPWSTFRLNLSCTSPYNADFDGDEMNLHIPQSLETRAEVENIHLASRQIITPQSNRPIMGIVQDSLLGAMKLTQRDNFIDRDMLMNLLMLLPEWNGVIPQACILKPTLLWSGKQIFSLIIPESVNLYRTTDGDSTTDELHWISPTDSIIIIEKGNLVAGRLCKRTLGAQAGSLFHICFLKLGHRVTGELYRNIQVVVNHWLMIEGHSVGIADTVADFATFQQIQAKIQEAKNKVVQVIQAAHNMELEPTPGSTLRQTFENLVNQILNDAREQTGSLALKSLTHFNNFKSMAIAGSKGSTINISQIIACVGQQNVEGKRISNGFTGRSLPHFLQGDCSAEARGFVENSYLVGLTPSEFFFHAMGGREGLIDTAVKTAETGYIQRRLIKAMETLMVNYDGTVRNSMNQLIQIRYGEDGLCGERVEFHDVNFKASHDAFQARHKLQTPLDLNIFTEESLEQISRSADVWEMLDAEWNRLQEDRRVLRKLFPTGHVETALPCNIHQIIQNAKKIFHITQNQKTNLTPVKITKDVEDLLSRCLPSGQADNLLFRFFVRSHLSSQLVLREHSLSSEAFDWVIGEIETRFQQAQINPGEMVGAIAAQSLGEPATQMTLNTFHFAGVSSKNVTLGVPRLNEIINVSRKPKAPSLTIFLHAATAQDVEKAKAVVNRIEHTTLRNLTQSASIHFDPDLTKTIIKEDQEFLDAYVSMPDFNKERVSPWLLRFDLDRKKMESKKLTLEFIAGKISQVFGEDLICMFSDNNSRKLVLRVHLLQNDCDKFKEDDKERMQDDVFLRYIEVNLLSNMTLLGIEFIKKVYMHLPNTADKKRHYITAAGEVKMKSEWLLETSGTALLPVLNDADVDATRSYSNDLCEIFQVLGIEAARKSIQKEINAVLQFYGLYVNYRHLALLSEVMTANGHLMAITRHGINQQSCGPLLKCSFEQSINALLEAAVFSETDSLRGVSESILLGQLPKIGTGSFDLILDAQKCLSENVVGCSNTCLTSNQLHTPWHLYGADYTSLSPADSIRRSYPCEAGLSPNNREGSWTSKSTTHERSQSTTIVQLHRHQPCELHQSLIKNFTVSTNNISYTTPYANRNKKTSPVSLPHSLCSPLSPTFSPTLSISSPSSFLLSENSNVVEGDRETPLSQSATHFPYSNLDSYSYLEPTQYTPKSSEYSIKSSHSSQWMSNRVINPNSFSSTCHIYSRNAHSKKFTKYYSTNISSISREHIINSPNYSPSLSNYSPSSPNYTPNSPNYSPSSLIYSPSSPNYTPSSPNYTPSSPNYSPSSPNYSETSFMNALKLPNYSPLALRSPIYSPTSPIYSPSSPAYSPSSPAYSPTSPIYRQIFSDISKKHSSQLPDHSSNTPSYSPLYSPTSPYFTDDSHSLTNYSPSLSKYSPTSQNSLLAGQHYSPTSFIYSLDTSQHSLTSPVSPGYSANPSIHSSYPPSALNLSPSLSNSTTFAVGSPAYSPSSPSYSPPASEFSMDAPSFSPSP